jgi:hypothetical protein
MTKRIVVKRIRHLTHQNINVEAETSNHAGNILLTKGGDVNRQCNNLGSFRMLSLGGR